MNRNQAQAAILFADITDSTRLFETVGDKVAREIERDWLRQVSGILPKFAGRLIKSIGDEVMCTFDSADHALLAASAIQAAVTAEPPEGYRITLHMGLHFGKVILEGEDVFGDTVNVAAYLSAVASARQIVMTEVTHKMLSDPLKAATRPIFRTVLKGQGNETIVYEVLWRTDNAEMTDSFFSSRAQPLVPGDVGGLILRHGGKTLHLNNLKPRAVLGRAAGCDLVMRDTSVTREHARIELQLMNFYLIDRSINGSYVLVDGRPEVAVLRRDLLLEGPGRISLGRSFSEDPTDVIEFARDRRSLFRV